VRILDKQINNTSVILLFEVGTKKLLSTVDVIVGRSCRFGSPMRSARG